MQKIEIVIYRFTGKQFFFEVPKQWCEECDLTISLVRRALRELELENDRRIKLEIKPWVANALSALLSGGWHPPVVTIDDAVFSQGIVPDKERFKRVIKRQLSLLPVPSDRPAGR